MATKKIITKVSSADSGAKSMEDLLKKTGYVLKGFKRGETVKGKVIEVTSKTVYVNIGGKTDAIVSEHEYELAKDYFRGLKPGQEVTGIVLLPESDAGQVVLSLKKAAVDSKWKIIEEAMASDSPVSVKVKEVTKGGLLVDMDGLVGFIPSSQLGRELDGNLSGVLNKQLKVKIEEADRATNRLVLSERDVSDAEELESKKKILENIKIGGEYDGLVTGLVPFGAFVEIKIDNGRKNRGKSSSETDEQKLEGLVHISEMSWEKVGEINKLIKEGDTVRVQVIGIDEDNGKLALSIKRLTSDPWLIVGSKYKTDSKHKGVVSKIAPYGILVRLEKGVEGLIHASKMPAEMGFKEGDEVEVFVESIDLDKRRLSLGVVLKSKPVGYK